MNETDLFSTTWLYWTESIEYLSESLVYNKNILDRFPLRAIFEKKLLLQDYLSLESSRLRGEFLQSIWQMAKVLLIYVWGIFLSRAIVREGR